jgi:hypothetical protein
MGSNSPESQWYVNCAHVNIIGAGGGEIPTDYAYAKFPGTYKAGDPRKSSRRSFLLLQLHGSLVVVFIPCSNQHSKNRISAW